MLFIWSFPWISDQNEKNLVWNYSTDDVISDWFSLPVYWGAWNLIQYEGPITLGFEYWATATNLDQPKQGGGGSGQRREKLQWQLPERGDTRTLLDLGIHFKCSFAARIIICIVGCSILHLAQRSIHTLIPSHSSTWALLSIYWCCSRVTVVTIR